MRKSCFEESFLKAVQADATDFLMNLIKRVSISNNEMEACEYAYRIFAGIEGIRVWKVPMDNTLKEYPLWCSGPYENNDYTGHYNIKVLWKGTGEMEPIYLNAHIDTVTASDPALLTPRLEDGTVYGLGACDDKGGIAAMYTVFRMLSHLKERPPFDVIGHIVVEEEIGGNGTLAITDCPMKGQAAIVFEPSAGKIQPVHRCGLWIKMICRSVACHTAVMNEQKHSSVTDLAFRAIDTLQKVHDEYCEECERNPVKYYEGYRPALNVGVLKAGHWPGTMADRAEIMASVAVLPNWTNEMIKERIAAAFANDPELREHVEIRYVFDRGSTVLDFDDPMVLQMQQCAQANGYSGEVESIKALCDMYFYHELHGIPAVTFGPGDVQYAHSNQEKICVEDILKTANTVHDFLLLRAGI